MLKKSRKSAQGCPWGGQNRSKGDSWEVQIGPKGALQRFQKPGPQKNALTDEKIKQIDATWDPKSIDFCFSNYIL